MFGLKLVSAALLLHLVCSHPMEEMLAKANKSGNLAGKQWAVLVAGSNNWHNYRHQSDVLHAYKIVKDHGIPDSQIILMIYDDLVNNVENPTKGKIINKHGGSNLYQNLEIDYKGSQVTAKNFLNVLQGNSAAMKDKGTEQVVSSGSNDHIFVFMDDHGSTGFFCFPSGGNLYTQNFNQALKNMHKERKYAEMVIYIEACEAGSMFHKALPSNINIYGTTASNERESSYACYYESSLRTYLGDEYSVNWMEDTDAHRLDQETLDEQYNTVRSKTKGSHVMKYGATKMGKEHICDYLGKHELRMNSNTATDKRHESDNVDSREVPIMIEFHQLKDAKSQSEKEEIFVRMHKMLEKRMEMIEKVRSIFEHSVQASNAGPAEASWDSRFELLDHDCYIPIVEKFHNKCYDLGQNDYALAYMHKFVTLCENGVYNAVVIEAIDRFCDGEKGSQII